MSHFSRFKMWKQAELITFLTCVLVICTAGLASAEKLTLDYYFEQPRVEQVTIDNVTYDRVFMTDAPNAGNIGEPALPARGASILLPYGAEVSSIEIVPSGKAFVGGSYYIEPVAQPIPLSADLSALKPPTPDAAIYASNVPFPSTRFERIGTYGFRGYRILTLMLQPVEYKPASGELYYYSQLKVVIDLEETGKSSPLYRGLTIDETEILSRIDNPEAVSSYDAAPKSGGRSFDLLIITSPAFAYLFDPLKDYHDTTGILTDIVTTDDIGSTDPDIVRDYIRGRYLADGIQYVLIGGDDDVIPSKDLYVISWPGDDNYVDYDMPGDLYFGCLDGTYNYDGDELNGEPTDGEGGGDVDLSAELYVGRASGSSGPEIYIFVEKTLTYLTTEEPYLDNVLMVGEQLGFGGFGEYGGYSCDQIFDISNADGYTTFGFPSGAYNVETLYDLTWPTNDWPSSEIISRVNDGRHIVNHYGHCNTSWALKLTSSNAAGGFVNEDLCFIYSQGCYAGNFDGADCWAEYVHTGSSAGAFAIVMNARYGWGDYGTDGPSHRFNREFWDAVYNPVEAKPEIGKANQDSKEDNLYRVNQSCMRWCYYQLTVFGDPTIPFKSVRSLTFSYPTGIPTTVAPEQATSFDVVVNEVAAGTIVPGSGQLHYTLNSGPVQTVAMTTKSASYYEATLPALQCGDQLEFYVSAEETTEGRFYDPDPSSPRQVSVIEEITTIFEDDFETDKGWTISGGQWARGVPTGQGGYDLQYGTPDPTSGCNGVNVYGYNLNGDYEDGLSEMHLTSPAIDCSGKSGIHLKFMRWLGVEIPTHDHAYVRVSNNGTDWTTVWQNTSCLGDLDWQSMDLDISAIADGQTTVYLRWTMGPTNPWTRYCGWNIDDVRVISYECIDFICGDANTDEAINILDVTFIINYLYKEGPPPVPEESANVNNDGTVNLLDVTHLVNYLYKEGPNPVCP
ncbi:MAG: choice-of-anchor J domain-containing protein [Candidatus Zixiibacteriota bacterium]|nr:MAG: choice-of-anchor J domain-containing protein [candidate division Zixibacteria bacterium]